MQIRDLFGLSPYDRVFFISELNCMYIHSCSYNNSSSNGYCLKFKGAVLFD